MKKNIPPAYLCGYDLQNGVRKSFLNKWFSRYLSIGDFKVSKKLFFTIKLLIKLDRQKIKKILHTVLETIISRIISQNFCKIGLNPGELELLENALVITLKKKKSLVRAPVGDIKPAHLFEQALFVSEQDLRFR